MTPAPAPAPVPAPVPASWHRRAPGIVAALAVAGLLAGLILAGQNATEPLRERLFDTMIAGRAPPVSDKVWVVEIGAGNAANAPWSRGDLAALIAKLAATKPAVIGLDIVLSKDCAPGSDTQGLATALASAPVLTGFVVPGPAGTLPAPQLPIAVMQNAPAWDAPGAETACPVFQAASKGAVLISLSGGRDGRVRTAPALGFVAGQPFAGLGVELARHAAGWPAPIMGGGSPGWLRLGGVTIPLDSMGQFRFVPQPPARRAALTVAAAAVLAGRAPEIPQGAVILIGSSLPEMGGLRASRATPLHASLHLHADVVTQLLSGHPFSRQPAAPLIEAMVAVAGAVLALLAVLRLAPLAAAAGASGLAVCWIAVTWATAVWGDQLLDPLLPALAMVGAASVALLAEARASRSAEANLSRRMRQHLPASVVDRVTDGTAAQHLKGEMREITALFTDIEGFSDLTRRLPTQALVALLDGYFTGLTRIIAARGGMVDKIVGDAVHAFFNAPVDQPDHVDQAIRAARDIRDFAGQFAQGSAAAAAGFGRTRIGVETGQALLGDVGQGGRTDYTAHGDAVNMAARLQEASKTLGTTVLIGPRAAALTNLALGPVSVIDLRSFGDVAVATLAD